MIYLFQFLIVICIPNLFLEFNHNYNPILNQFQNKWRIDFKVDLMEFNHLKRIYKIQVKLVNRNNLLQTI